MITTDETYPCSFVTDIP